MEERADEPKSHWFLFIGGVIMPAISITVEASTHICAEVFFDPIPTTWHLLLVIFVPLAQLQAWFALRRGSPDRLRLAGFGNAIVIGISIFYSIVYLPILPMALLTVLIGLGFLPLAPYFSLVAALVMRHKLNRIAAISPPKTFAIKKRGLVVGLGAALALLGIIELPATITRIGLQKAVSDSPQTRAEGIRFLRKYGNKDALLRSCYNQSGMATDFIGFAFLMGNPVMPGEAQKIYYRVTGETFDSSIPPERIGGRVIPQDTVDWDADQGGSQIHGKLKGLSLANSKLDASIDADGGVGYMEWTLVFRNDSTAQREARAQVQLPPGGVVSRLSLWVNDEPREAAFAGRGKVTQAYQQVAIRQRRDPVLVTTAGRDRILVQCFPVPANGGEMKIRFGITLPLPLAEPNIAQLLLPYFADRNFRIADGDLHLVRIKSKTPLRPFNQRLRTGMEGHEFILAGSIRDEELSEGRAAILVDRSDIQEMWSKDPFEKGFIVQQKVEERTPAHLQRIVLVVDTSATVLQNRWQVQSAVESLPREFDVKLVLADADLIAADKWDDNLAAGPDAINSALHDADFTGGADNVPALVKAWDLAAEKPGNNAIVWIHDPQRLLIHSPDELKRRWNNRPYGPTLYSIQATRGAVEIEKALDGIDEVKSVARTGNLDQDLNYLFARLTGRMKTYEYVRSSKKLDAKLTSGVIETSDQLARLWANDEVARILAPQNAELEDAAITLAARYQLVTPVSGAVVLETEQQYKANDLKPVDAGTVPTIPEPEMIVLFIVAGAFMIWLAYMKYRKSGPGRCEV
jgi:hypothetical protein